MIKRVKKVATGGDRWQRVIIGDKTNGNMGQNE